MRKKFSRAVYQCTRCQQDHFDDEANGLCPQCNTQKPTMKTNQELIEILKPALDSIQEIGICPHLNDVRVIISKNGAGEYDLKVDAWAKSGRIKCDSLDTVLRDVEAYDDKAERRKETEARIAQLQAELAALQPKPTKAE